MGRYEHLVQCGTLREDVQQKYLIHQLAQLQHTLKNYSNSMYLRLLAPTLHSHDGKSPLTLHNDLHFRPSGYKGGGTINKVKDFFSSYIKCGVC